ncbi:MAG: TrkA family potassium uptake protein [Malacoplasma sp.]|nr:TrkA family potassium uptake protein [Malacoplasma sp.]
MDKKVKNEYYVIGFGKFGEQVAKTLYDNGLNVVIIENDKKRAEKAAELSEYTMVIDATDLVALKETGIANAKTVVVAVSDIQNCILICANLIQLGSKGSIIARAQNNIHKMVLKTMGIENVTIPEIEVAHHIALQAMYSFNQAVYSLAREFSWTTLVISNGSIVNQEIRELALPSKYGINVLFINRGGKNIYPITPNEKFQLGDLCTIMCEDNKLGKALDFFTDPLFRNASATKSDDIINVDKKETKKTSK